MPLEEAADRYRKTFDCVCCFQVLEHVPEPAAFLSQCIDLLKAGGTFIAVVPNRDGFLKYYYEPLDLPPHHMSQWNAGTFKSLERYFPVEFVKAEIEPLGDSHIPAYLDAHLSHLTTLFPVAGRFTGKRTHRLLARCLRAGLRRLATGHSVYAQFVTKG
jgi:SAM-dependent methyltransferase